jgi:hypothetical protein
VVCKAFPNEFNSERELRPVKPISSFLSFFHIFVNSTNWCEHLKIRARVRLICFVSLLVILVAMFPVQADNFRIMEGAELQYGYERLGSAGGGATGNLTFTIESLNQTAVHFQINGTGSTEVYSYQIEYRNGIPVYADRLEALIYLPAECVAESLQGKLKWTESLESTTLATVVNEAVQTQNFTVPAGFFQTLNLTLSLVGVDYGTLTMIYSVNSGVLVYEQWIPADGDIVIQELTAVTYASAMNQTLLDFLIPTATLILPVGTAINEGRAALRKRRNRKQITPPENAEPQRMPPRTSLCIGVAAGLLILASVSLPWSQLSNLQVYLPSSLPLLVAKSTFSLSTSTFITASLLANSAAVAAWLSVAVEVYIRRKLPTQLIGTSSALLAFASAMILVQAGWPLSWGSLIIIVGGAMMFASLFVAMSKEKIDFYEYLTTRSTAETSKRN